jgi:branched-chain amino acid transport system ATP-binding protein
MSIRPADSRGPTGGASHGSGALVEVFRRPPPHGGASELRISALGVRFGGINALDDVTFTVDKGDFTAIVGPNGAGKTTLLNSICGVNRRVSTGSVAIDGQEILGRSANAIAAMGIGRSFQHPPLLERETVLENVMIGAHLRLKYSIFDQLFRVRHVRLTEAPVLRQARTMLQMVGLDSARDRPVSAMPFGARKVLDVVRAALSSPSILLLDEPTSGLDSAEREKMRNLLLAIRSTGLVTMIAVEHHLEFVRQVATSVVGLKGGTVFAAGELRAVIDSEHFRDVLLGNA